MEREGWITVSPDMPCPVCKKTDWCTIGKRMIHCMRPPNDTGKPCKGGGSLYPREAQYQDLPLPPRPPSMSDEELSAKWLPLAQKAMLDGRAKIARLAKEIGVDTAALVLLQVGHAEFGGQPAWTIPERNARGLVLGIVRRLVHPKDGVGKLCCKGSRRGLTYCDDWASAGGPVYLPEGMSDVATGLTLGLCVLGRPSCRGGVEMLADLLRPYPRRKILVVGENDRKSAAHVLAANPRHSQKCRGCMCCWPGKAGAVETAAALAAKLKRSVGIIFPPQPYKDLRQWFQAEGPAPGDRLACLVWGGRIRGGNWRRSQKPASVVSLSS